jgi:hypothetical protein
MPPKKISFGLELDKYESCSLLFALRFAKRELVKDSKENGKLPPNPKEIKDLNKLDKKLCKHIELLQGMESALKKPVTETVKAKRKTVKP